jgi:hypothetical protein
MSIILRNVLAGVLLAASMVPSAQAGGLRNAVANKLGQSSGRRSLSTMDVIKAQNFATDVKSKLQNHRFEPSTMDVIKAKNALSDAKQKVLNHRFEPSTMDVIKASNFLQDVKGRVLNRD